MATKDWVEKEYSSEHIVWIKNPRPFGGKDAALHLFKMEGTWYLKKDIGLGLEPLLGQKYMFKTKSEAKKKAKAHIGKN